ncbi:MAG: hypothetical protein FK730_05190 [Asgard group archaeon]|nr:hypothetical protein [Asgard group archaeon]
MSELKLVSRGPILDYIKEKTNGLNIANELKDQIIDFFEEKLREEINNFCNWSKEIMDLQGKRTVQERDWEYLRKKL